MSEFIFRFPGDCPELTHDGLARLPCINGDRERPVFSHAEPVSPEAIEDRRRRRNWAWQANLTAGNLPALTEQET